MYQTTKTYTYTGAVSIPRHSMNGKAVSVALMEFNTTDYFAYDTLVLLQ